MKFIDSYKRLEKLLSEAYGENHGISAYIDEMVNTSDGSYYVLGWKEDLKQLKHYRWVRNQIVHELNCTEENMCTPEDIQWINDFYSRVMATDDPLAKYRRLKEKTNDTNLETEPQYEEISRKTLGCLSFLLGLIIGAVATVFVFDLIKF